MTIPRRRTGPLCLTGVVALVLVLVAGASYWVLTRADSGDPASETEASLREPRRVMLAGDSMTQGANGDRTWRYHLWNHLDANVDGLEFVGPYTDPAPQDMILPVPTTEEETPETPDGDPAESYDEDDASAGPSDVPEESEGPDDVDSATWPGTDGNPGTAEYRDPDFGQSHNALWGRTLHDAAASIREEVRIHEPDVLCVMLGVNDLLWPVTMHEMETRLRGYVEAARQSRPGLRVVIAEALPIALAQDDEGFALRQFAYNELVRKVAADLSSETSPVVSLDVAGSEAWDVAEDTYDGTHPDAGGERKIAAAFADALSREFGMGPVHPRPLSR